MGKTVFKIDGKDFIADSDMSRGTSFEIKSVPRPYQVLWDTSENPFKLVNELIPKESKNLLLIDRNVYNIYAKHLTVPESKIYIADATEEFKTLNGVVSLIDFLEKNRFTKGEKLIVVGGGIIEDVAAFAGACYKRGIPWIYFPTTLLSMCDSCIGGKTGINHNNAKNQLALFSAPSQVIINPKFLETLDFREIKSGMGEILKLHITGGKKFLDSYERHIPSALALDYSAYKPLILGALSVKKSIVEEDEFELNHRRSLNYGHTLGHAIEVLSDYRIPHGQAVTIGMLLVNEISNRRGTLGNTEKRYLEKLSFEILDRDILKGISVSEMGDLLKKDKKTMGNSVNLVVLESIGDMRFLPLNLDSALLDEIKEIIKDIFNS